MNRRIVAIVAAVVLAALGGILVFVYAKGADTRAIAEQEPRTVYITQQTVTSGTTLKNALAAQQIKESKVAALGVPAGALTSVDPSNEKLLALSDLPPGQMVMSASWGTTPTGTKNIDVPKGQLAVSVTLDDQHRVGDFVTPGSRVTLFVTFKPEDSTASGNSAGGNKGGTTSTLPPNGLTTVLLDNVLVIGKGDKPLNAPPQSPAAAEGTDGVTATGGAQSQATVTLLTVALKPEDAIKIAHVVNNNGALYAGLRSSAVTVPPALKVTTPTLLK